MYSLIGGKSPILDITTAQAEALQKSLNTEVEKLRSSKDKTSQLPSSLPSQARFKVYIGMRYWHPFIKDTVRKIFEDGVKHIIVLTLYPQYSVATTGSAVSAFKRAIERLRITDSGFLVQYIEQWYDFPLYIDAVSDLIYNSISLFPEEKIDILFSAHNLPEKFIRDGDPYVEHTKCTVQEVMKRLSAEPYTITGIKWHLAFQSKSGPVPWMKPTTDEVIVKLAGEGIRNLLVVPISFVSDHIETLYEIDILYHQLAAQHGVTLKRCKSLNTTGKFINALKELIFQKVSAREGKK
jgi:ferrochelatase